MSSWCHCGATLTPHVPLQEFTATEQVMKQHMTLGELQYPVPQSFEPVKTFFKGLMEAMQSTMQTPLEVRLKQSKSPCGQLRASYSFSVLYPRDS